MVWASFGVKAWGRAGADVGCEPAFDPWDDRGFGVDGEGGGIGVG